MHSLHVLRHFAAKSQDVGLPRLPRLEVLFGDLRGGVDVGFALPWKHSSIWLYSYAGWADGNRLDPLTNYYFGGFGNNYVDRGSVKRYREFYAMPGFELNEIGGRNFARTMLEWNLPPLRFERGGSPGFYFTWARTSIFAQHLSTNLDDSAIRREVQSAGIQVDFRITILSRMNMTLSFGYARGFGDDRFVALAVDHDLPAALALIAAGLRIAHDRQAPLLELMDGGVDMPRHVEGEVLAHHAHQVIAGVTHVVLGLVFVPAHAQVTVDRVKPLGHRATAIDVGLLGHYNLEVAPPVAGFVGGAGAAHAAADNQDVAVFVNGFEAHQ